MKNDTGTDPSTCSKISEKLKDKKLKSLYKEAIEMICEDYLHIPQELRIRSRGTERHSASN